LLRRALVLACWAGVVCWAGAGLLPVISTQALAASGPAGIITTIAGDGERKDFQPGPALKASLQEPTTVIVAPDGSLYIADLRGDHIRKVSPPAPSLRRPEC